MPSYINDVLRFGLEESGALCMITYFAVFASTILFGWFFSVMKDRFGWRTLTVRIWAMYVAFGFTSVLLVVAGFVAEPHAAFALLLASQVRATVEWLFITFDCKSLVFMYCTIFVIQR